MSAGVPTVWQGCWPHEANGLKFSTMRRTVIGGSACPPAMIRKFRDDYGVQVLHAWGMTEMSPLGTAARSRASTCACPEAAAVRPSRAARSTAWT
jgi:3-(methylthio)propionyl---CoA ligase